MLDATSDLLLDGGWGAGWGRQSCYRGRIEDGYICGIALLASYMVNKAENETLDDYLNSKVFAGNAGSEMEPDAEDVKGFDAFIER